MALASLPAAAALKALNDFLLTRSYIEGFTPSAADLVVLAAVGKADLSAYENVQRWSRHISSYSSAEQAKFPGEKKAISQYGPKAAAAAPAAAAEAKEDEDDIDLFGSDDDEVDEEAEKLKQQRLEEYKAKKANKPKVIAKSSVVLDVKPWDDETDMKALEEGVRGITMDGLLWGASKLVAVGFGIKKLQIGCVIEDDKVSTDELIEDHIMALEDYVQSVDIAAFQKI